MSSLLPFYDNIVNGGVPSGPLVSGQVYTVTANTNMLFTVISGTGSATLEVDNGQGYVAELLPDGTSQYCLKPCDFRVTLTGTAGVSAS